MIYCALASGRIALHIICDLKRKRTKVHEHFERTDARPEGWSTGCAE